MTNGDPLHGDRREASARLREAHVGDQNKADLKAQYRAKGFAPTNQHRGRVRDKSRIMITLYGSITLILWGFAAFAFQHDDSAPTPATSRWALDAKARHHKADNPQINSDPVSNR